MIRMLSRLLSLAVLVVVGLFLFLSSTVYAQTPSAWRAQDAAVGPDGKTRVMWRHNTYGYIFLSVINSSGLIESSFQIGDGQTGGGPVPMAEALAVGPDNRSHMIWNLSDGKVWLMDGTVSGEFAGYNTYGPFYENGGYWKAVDIAVDSNNQIRVLWRHPDGRIQLWSHNHYLVHMDTRTHGPFTGAVGKAISVLGDGNTRLMWQQNTNGLYMWSASPAGDWLTTYGQYGPFAGWEPVDLAAGSDNKTRVLWQNISTGQISLWRVGPTGTHEAAYDYGPYAGWRADKIALAGGVGRLLLNHTSGGVSLWNLHSDGYWLGYWGQYNYVPLNLSATAGIQRVSLQWANDPYLTDWKGYKIYCSPSPSGPYSHIATVGRATTSYTHTNLSPGTTYYYKVSTLTLDNTLVHVESGLTNAVSAVPSGPPAPPTNVTATAGNANVRLGWQASAGATGYYIDRGPSSSGPYSRVQTVSGGSTTQWYDDNVSNGTTYWYQVSAFNGIGASAPSTPVSALPHADPHAPRNLQAVAGTWQVTLSWQPGEPWLEYPDYRYEVYRSVPRGQWISLGAVSSTSFFDTSVQNGTTYWYQVRAVATNTTETYATLIRSGPSNDASARPTAEGFTITPVSGLTTTEAGGTAQFTVRLTSMPSANVTLALSSSDTTEGTLAVNSLTFTPANWNTPQSVTVTGVDDALDDGDQAYTIVTGAVTSQDASYGTLNPAGVPDVAVTNTDNDDPVPPSLSISDVRVTEGDTGTVNAVFKVRLSAASAQTVTVEFGTANGTASAPADYTAQTGTINFNPNEISKDLEIEINGDLIDEADETFTVTLSAPVNAVIAQGQGIGIGTIVDNDGSQAPTGLTATGKYKKIELSWNEVENAASYRIQRSTSSTGGFALVGTVDAPTVTYTDADPALVIGTTYYYRVTAVNGNGQESPPSNIASAKPKPPFEIINVSNGDVLVGDVQIDVEVHDPSIGVGQIELKVDGTTVTAADPWGDASDVRDLFFRLETKEFGNGNHTLTIGDPNYTESRQVVFTNTISNLRVCTQTQL